MVPVFLAHSVD